jgi:hypothetical protein
MRFGRALCFVIMVIVGGTSPSLACKGTKILYNDNFTERDDGWYILPADFASGKVNVGQGRILVKPEPERGYSLLNMAFGLAPDADICVTARIVESPDLSKSGLGIIFWAKGFDDNYLFQLLGNGTYYVTHWVDRSWQSVTPIASVRSYKQGLGQDNQLRVVTKGQTVSVFVNDEQVARFRAPTPTGLVKVGLRASALANEPSSFEFREFTVTDVP